MLSELRSLITQPPKIQTKVLERLTEEQRVLVRGALDHEWALNARPEQLAPPGDWYIWIYLAGRGSGKTRSGAEWVRRRVKQGSRRVHLVAPTAGDARDVMVSGISGILSVCWERDETDEGEPMGFPIFEPSKRSVTWANGAQAILFSAEEPNRLRGPQCDTLWADELAAWQRMQETWDMAMMGLRIKGGDPRGLVTTTPKPLPLIRELVGREGNVVSRGTTWDNRKNLDDKFFKDTVAKYQGTRLGRQELEGQILEEADGALWKRENIRYLPGAPDLRRIVVAVDPATTSNDESALTGIVVAGIGFNGMGYVLADYSGRYTPAEWARKAIEAYDKWKADRIVAEGNQGGEMVSHTIWTARANLPVTVVHASRAKQARAEPVAALYEQGRVYHVGAYPELEDQLCTWEPLSGMPSPDRLDALVWAITDLAISGGTTVFTEAEEFFKYEPGTGKEGAGDMGASLRF